MDRVTLKNSMENYGFYPKFRRFLQILPETNSRKGSHREFMGKACGAGETLGESMGGVDHRVQPGRACSCVDLYLVMFGHLRKLDCSSIQGCSQHT